VNLLRLYVPVGLPVFQIEPEFESYNDMMI
jgi:hypothetical protein